MPGAPDQAIQWLGAVLIFSLLVHGGVVATPPGRRRPSLVCGSSLRQVRAHRHAPVLAALMTRCAAAGTFGIRRHAVPAIADS
jgi:hypothetical protein